MGSGECESIKRAHYTPVTIWKIMKKLQFERGTQITYTNEANFQSGLSKCFG